MLTHVTLQKLSNFAELVEGLTPVGPPTGSISRALSPTRPIVIRTAKNVDTLYSAATLDLKAEPIVLPVPATDRYFMLPMLSFWT